MNVIKEIQQILAMKIGLNPDSLSNESWKKLIAQRKHLRSVQTDGDYLNLVSHYPFELDALIEEVIVPETWFYRDPSAFHFLSNYIRNVHLIEKPFTPFRILCLPCSSGQEPYSIVMAMMEVGLLSTHYQVDGIDVSQKALDLAEKGIYSKNSFRGECSHFQSKYFKPGPTGYSLDPLVKQQVNFVRGNIIDPYIAMNAIPYDAIFCRNLFIYLTPEAQQKAFLHFNTLLKEEGFLILAPVEMELARKYGYSPVAYPKACTFQKMKVRVSND